ncbi:hypothetical protein MTIM_15250 [Mycobacterium timonense]|uniref:LuxR family transcriptional regulator n=1 Tax=Mycobacterium timonense TaxID=701043 RepID=A0A7I9Z438_9MYCO|nr:hypothetical protein MTIM_15250 [Mycobacterium timonense]
MLAAAHNTLGQDKNLVVVVDDAQLLDPLSATLVNQLAASRSARLIVTIRSGEPVLDAVTALLKERMLLTVRIDPFTREQTALLAGAVLAPSTRVWSTSCSSAVREICCYCAAFSPPRGKTDVGLHR